MRVLIVEDTPAEAELFADLILRKVNRRRYRRVTVSLDAPVLQPRRR